MKHCHIFMTKDYWALQLNVSHHTRKHVAWGLGWGLQTDNEGNPVRAYHSGDMNHWRAWIAINLEDKSAMVFFTNGSNGHMLTDSILSPHIELAHAMDYFFPKYGFARKVEKNWHVWNKHSFNILENI